MIAKTTREAAVSLSSVFVGSYAHPNAFGILQTRETLVVIRDNREIKGKNIKMGEQIWVI